MPALDLDVHTTTRGMYLINSEEQKIITDIFETFLKLGSLKATSKYCNEKSYRTKKRVTYLLGFHIQQMAGPSGRVSNLV